MKKRKEKSIFARRAELDRLEREEREVILKDHKEKWSKIWGKLYKECEEEGHNFVFPSISISMNPKRFCTKCGINEE